ncbi:TonB-dependent receptor [Methylobacter sp.]|uniref:TonB-dependent receptor plug domain-containing protein n=1 Tax=Methylobacter sp. TaxID=2051955 RepID=UPI0012079D4B|nr:TonB-dependent receptor [Methylobacter sp.]TAK65224.1 MAG: TonB-dependent receptor [Methylobacter sp.]
MRVEAALIVNCLALMLYCSDSARAASEKMDDFFAMSPAELAATPVTIATGTPMLVSQSAAVTSVITAEQIKSMGATELHEVLETVPGVHASIQALTGDYNYSMRGIQNASNSQILILLNGTRVTSAYRGTLMIGLELPIEAIQQVEVIRGPGSALYGADAFAGVINIITKKAKDIDGTTVGGRVGDHDSQSGWGQHGTTWAGWDIATSLQYQHSGGDSGRVVKSDSQTALDNALGTHASHAPGSLDTQYENFNGHLNLQRKHWDIGFWAFSGENGLRAGAAGALDPKGVINGEQYVGDVRFSTEDWFENWEFIAHTSYLHNELLANFRPFPENSVLPIGSDSNVDLLTPSSLILFPQGVISNSDQTENIPSIELSSIYRGLRNHQLLVSAGFRYEDITVKQLTNFGPGVVDPRMNVIGGSLTNVTGTPFVFLPSTHRSVWSYVVQDEWRFADDWQLTAGVRYDDYSDFGGTVNPRMALVWDINTQMTSKLLYGKAFRAPNFTEQGNQNNPVQLGNKSLKPETINTYEWAIDYRPVPALRTAANLYFYQIKELITLVPDVGRPSSTFQNNGNQDGYGSELEWNWQVQEQWNLSGNYAWQYARNNETKSRVTGVPEHQVYVAAAWQFIPKWQIQSQLNWIGSRINPIPDNGKLVDYQTVDFTLRGKKLYGHLNVAASLRNAFDTNYSEPAAVRIGDNFPMQGRSFYLETSINF